jgi:citrate lyase gamma subunit
MPAEALNTYKVLDAQVMVVTEGALNVIEGNLIK